MICHNGGVASENKSRIEYCVAILANPTVSDSLIFSYTFICRKESGLYFGGEKKSVFKFNITKY